MKSTWSPIVPPRQYYVRNEPNPLLLGDTFRVADPRVGNGLGNLEPYWTLFIEKKAYEKAILASKILIENAECRGDEDCDHCVAVQILKQLGEISHV